MKGLHGKVAVLTGMTRAMGQGIARRLVAEGVAVVGCGRSTERGRAIAEALSEEGGDAVFVTADVTDAAQAQAAVQTALDRHGRLDIVVNNAAATDVVRAGRETNVVDEDPTVFDTMLRVGVVGPFHLFKYGAPPMIEQGSGVFVNISSTAADNAAPGLPGYSASKGALEALTRQVAADLGRYGVRCNVLQLGKIDTADSVYPAGADPAMDAAFREMVMTPMFGDEHDVGGCVAFLASDDARYITGATLRLDGGGAVKTHLPHKP